MQTNNAAWHWMADIFISYARDDEPKARQLDFSEVIQPSSVGIRNTRMARVDAPLQQTTITGEA